MDIKPLVSLAIPTYNRADFLKKLLSQIVPQAEALRGKVQICLSNNGSTDNTRQVIMDFKNRWPDLIAYNENEKDLGADKNLLLAMGLAKGEYIWPFGDDDLIVEGGLKKVVDFISGVCDKNTGLIMLSHESYFPDERTGNKIVHLSTAEKDKPKVVEIDPKDILGIKLANTFMSVVVFNNEFLGKIMCQEKKLIKEALGNYYVHVFLYNLMFLKYPGLKVFKFNEIIVCEDLHYYKYYIEDKFRVYYASRKKLDNLLLSQKYMTEKYRKIFIAEKNYLARGHIKEMCVMKAFGIFNYSSFWGCIKLFFKRAGLFDATLFSIFFIVLNFIPSFILKELYKFFIKIKYSHRWEKVWLQIVVANTMMSKGSRRLTC